MPFKDPARHRESCRRYKNNLRAIRVHQAIKRLGGRCVACGTVEMLQFDHILPETKCFNLVKRADSVSKARWEAEVAKCQLLCFSCHIEKTNCDRKGVEFKILDPWEREDTEEDFNRLWECIP